MEQKQTQAPPPFPDEVVHLAQISARLATALGEAEQLVEKMEQDYTDAKRYMVQNRGEIDPHEMFQSVLALREIDSSGAFAVEMRDRLTKLKDSPYFARIDFLEAGNPAPAEYYIGRFTFTHRDDWLIYDWRAPMASMFYDYETGPAAYTAPGGEVTGELTRKRQFKIEKGKLAYALESTLNVQDDVLQKELSHTSDERMKSIISTIQREQNQIIRSERTGTMVIQGVAGSGKTSIALHRIAFLLYRFRDKLSAQNVTILSPNRVFGDYISGVLPELGEEPVFQVSPADLADIQLEGVVGFLPDRDPLETDDGPWAARVRFKSTLEFVRKMDEYIAKMPGKVFEAKDYALETITIPAGWISARYEAYHKYPVKKRLEMMADDCLEYFIGRNTFGEELPKPRGILKTLRAMLTVKNTMALYKDFYKKLGAPGMLAVQSAGTLEWNDVYPFLYLHAAFAGLRESPRIRHLVVDEMQDYTPIQLAVLNRMFPCPKTILGDFGQRVDPNHCHTLADLQALYPGAAVVELNTSYRSTWEIISFAKKIQANDKLEAIHRHGEAPKLTPCAGPQQVLDALRGAIGEFAQSGQASLGLITKTNSEARALHEALLAGGAEGDTAAGQAAGTGIHLITPQTKTFAGGISVTSVQMCKGLEFDRVVVVDADAAHYHTEEDRGLLYVACTRAMHSLGLVWQGRASAFLPKG